ncbi:lipoprotein NlpD [Ectothiorhodosinus mongolicus]|uniref:Lipoprotein NlpD n=1 Tax=Ectothiorhodosinus mongolicus TaxID=233100 RepID=A0A1R3VMJ7_9GAMM|nr:peptidoglycan DD-metalloendopeptidase family protein [Ectothiorhodosinus mongolicus]SIT65810.1 lipoprotein NlpD [Ectothiorhodosinus mongolicus]
MWMRFAIIIFLSLVIVGCALPPESVRAFRAGEHLVRQNESLYSISFRYGVQWQELAAWNGIRPPYTIYAGQRIRVTPPTGAAPVARAPSQPTPQRPQQTAQRDRQPAATPAPAARPAPAPSTPYRGNVSWQWPTQGQVIRGFPSEGSAARRGIGIAGQPGQPVRAAAEGEVVYSGSGLVGYGRLIIIKHDARYLSAYAHNEKILVNEGDRVSAGQEIALLGDTGTDRHMLHFEIREDGRPVDPLRFLPRR